jgi:anti-anti-sigma factor
MDIEVRIDGNQVTLRIRGRLAQPDASLLPNTISRLLDEGHLLFVLDFSEVSEIDSTGLGAVVRAHAAAHHRRAQIGIENASGRLRDLISMTKLLTPFE